MATEADTRMTIDKLLEAAGWTITNKAQVSTEEALADGRADYVLKDARSRPLAVIEAKKFSVDPYSAKAPSVIVVDGNGTGRVIEGVGGESAGGAMPPRFRELF